MSKCIRTFKRALLEDEKISELSDGAFRVFVAAVLLADDHGNLRWSAKSIRKSAFWGRDSTVEEIAEFQKEVARFLEVYDVNGETYAHLRNWDRHQRVDNAGKPEIPLPPGAVIPSQLPRAAANGGDSPPRAAGKERKGLGKEPPKAPQGAETGGGIANDQTETPPSPSLALATPTPAVSETRVVAATPAATTDPPTTPGDPSGTGGRPESEAAPEGQPRRSLPVSEVRFSEKTWMASYTEVMSASLGRPWAFTSRHIHDLVAAIETHCPDRTRIDGWIRDTVRTFGAALKANPGRQQFFGGGTAAGLLLWLNQGRPADLNARAGAPPKPVQPSPPAHRPYVPLKRASGPLQLPTTDPFEVKSKEAS